MIDLHTHLLPNIDDGANDIETALHMTEALYTQNVRKAVYTPHFDPSSSSIEDFDKQRSFAIAKLGGARIQLIPARETILHEYLFHYYDLSSGNSRESGFLTKLFQKSVIEFSYIGSFLPAIGSHILTIER